MTEQVAEPTPVEVPDPEDEQRFHGLHAKIAHVQAMIGGLGSDKTARIQSPKATYSYDYLTEGAIMASVRRMLAPLGVAVYVSCEEEQQRGNMTVVTMAITFADAESGDQFVVRAKGYGTDPGDKGYTKAVTSAVRVGLSKTFLQSGDIDPEEHYVERTSTATGGAPAPTGTPTIPPRTAELVSAQRDAANKLMGLVGGDVAVAREVVQVIAQKDSIRELLMEEVNDIDSFLRWQAAQEAVDVSVVEQAADWKTRFGDIPY